MAHKKKHKAHHKSHTAASLRQPHSQSYLKHHQNNLIAQHQLAAVQNAMQHHVDRVRQQAYVPVPRAPVLGQPTTPCLTSITSQRALGTYY